MNLFPTGARRGQTAPSAPILLSCALLVAALVATPWSPAAAQDTEKAPETPPGEKKDGKKEVAVIKTAFGTIVFEFLPDVAPKMVANFKDLAGSKFYDGTTFHRVIPGFMIQGGDPLSKDNNPNNDGTGEGPRKMQAEFTTKYSHERGIVSTARSSDPNSGSCQFFIMDKKSSHLDNKYTIFGRVIEGMDVVDKIVAVPTGRANRPTKNVVMESVTIETR
jgi:peptidyl-prolyl cis-trans isomerase B (cyclophilin B)